MGHSHNTFREAQAVAPPDCFYVLYYLFSFLYSLFHICAADGTPSILEEDKDFLSFNRENRQAKSPFRTVKI